MSTCFRVPQHIGALSFKTWWGYVVKGLAVPKEVFPGWAPPLLNSLKTSFVTCEFEGTIPTRASLKWVDACSRKAKQHLLPYMHTQSTRKIWACPTRKEQEPHSWTWAGYSSGGLCPLASRGICHLSLCQNVSTSCYHMLSSEFMQL